MRDQRLWVLYHMANISQISTLIATPIQALVKPVAAAMTPKTRPIANSAVAN